MDYDEDIKGINWHIGIPVVLWIGITVLGIIKVLLGSTSELEAKGIVITIISTFNSCTFSTFIPVVVCMLYQYFTTVKEKREAVSGLAMRKIPATFILTAIYSIVAIFDAAISHFIMAIIFLIINIAYVICFFSLFLVRKEKKKEGRLYVTRN